MLKVNMNQVMNDINAQRDFEQTFSCMN
uniref:Uncharacterized protein n=1 Tax=Anguilla anguilla TaxID=7936 RepID=A0A0E9QZL8_ANGAN